VFVPDSNTATTVLRGVFQTHGQLWTLVVPKGGEIPDLFTPSEAAQLVDHGALRLSWAGRDAARQEVVLTAVGAYQLEQVLVASARLADRGVAHSVVYLLEPGRFRGPRNDGEASHLAPEQVRADLYPDEVPARVFVSHTRPEAILGALQPLHTGWQHTAGLGFTNHGGTLNVAGLLYLNGCSWAHVLAETARVTDRPLDSLLEPAELDALARRRSPEGVIVPRSAHDEVGPTPG
jgi:phosphoketolase